MSSDKKRSPRAISVRTGVDSDRAHGAITPNLVLSSNFSFEGFAQKRPYDYSRSGNPTRDALAGAIAELEGGAGAVITASGMAAVNLLLAPLKPNDVVVAPNDCYGGTYRLLRDRSELGHFRVIFTDLTNPSVYGPALAEKPALVLIESPSNPLLRITDIVTLAAAAHKAGAVVAADNTFLSPVLQLPLELGVDVVVHSMTKYLNGHSDVVGGAVVAKTPEAHALYAAWANTTGVTGAPFDSWLVLRGLRTLTLRVREQQQSADEIATFLSGHPGVAKVYYPGLKNHPGHDIAARQQKGFGAMLSFELKDASKTEAFVNALTAPGGTFSLAESLGGFESLIAHPATMTHASMTAAERAEAGISDGLLRVSVGLEPASDLIAALTATFAAI